VKPQGLQEKERKMMTIENRNSPPVQLLGGDLRKVADEATLLRITLEAVTEQEAFAGLRSTHDNLPMLLTLTSYAYASGIYFSQEIEQGVLGDPTLRYICAYHFPSWQDIRRFRRSHRRSVERTLSSILSRLYFRYVLPSCPELVNELSQWHEQARVEANNRIEHAIIMDGVEADL